MIENSHWWFGFGGCQWLMGLVEEKLDPHHTFFAVDFFHQQLVWMGGLGVIGGLGF